jgi:cytochrome oxidase assembly protein ShyY1
MKTIASVIGLLLVIAAMWYGGWQLSRWWNYKFGYESKVQAEVQKQVAPLEKRVTELEQEVNKLKK